MIQPLLAGTASEGVMPTVSLAVPTQTFDKKRGVVSMTAGNQGAAWDKAKAELKKDPNSAALKAQEARARAELNESLARAGQSKRY